MIQDIIGRLKTLRLNIVNSPDFNTYATNKSKMLIDQVLQAFIKTNQRTQQSYLGFNVNNRIDSSFNLRGDHSIRNKVQIINDMNNTRLAIKISPEIPSEMKKMAMAKLDMIIKL